MFRVRSEKCESCLYVLKYPKETRDGIMGDVERSDGFVQCHNHDLAAHVCCRGYWDAVGDSGGSPVQIAWRFHQAGADVIEWVPPDRYPPVDEDHDGYA